MPYNGGDWLLCPDTAIHLGSGTHAGDGAGWYCHFSHTLSATGQTVFPLPFPSVDVMHGGFAWVSSPTVGGTLGPVWGFGLHRMHLVVASDRDKLLAGHWHASPLEGWQPPDPTQQVERVREVVVYDANGDALRYVGQGTGDPGNLEWTYAPGPGNYATLEHHLASGVHILKGGPPGSLRQGGTWTYHFGTFNSSEGWGSGAKARLQNVVYGQQSHAAIKDPLGNQWSVTPSSGQTLLHDLQTGSQLRFSTTEGEVAFRHPLRNGGDWIVLGNGIPEGDSRSLAVTWTGELNDETVQWIGSEFESLQVKGAGETQAVFQWTWSDPPLKELFLYWTAYGGFPENTKGRLESAQAGGLLPLTHDYLYQEGSNGARQFKMSSERGARIAWLTYDFAVGASLFTRSTLVQPSLSDPDENEKFQYLFDSQGLVAEVRYFVHENDQTP